MKLSSYNIKIVQWIDGAIDYLYKTIKAPDKSHELNVRTTALANDASTQKNSHWIYNTGTVPSIYKEIILSMIGSAIGIEINKTK